MGHLGLEANSNQCNYTHTHTHTHSHTHAHLQWAEVLNDSQLAQHLKRPSKKATLKLIAMNVRGTRTSLAHEGGAGERCVLEFKKYFHKFLSFFPPHFLEEYGRGSAEASIWAFTNCFTQLKPIELIICYLNTGQQQLLRYIATDTVVIAVAVADTDTHGKSYRCRYRCRCRYRYSCSAQLNAVKHSKRTKKTQLW